MNPALVADLITTVHLGIVLYILVGQVLILVGWGLGWAWIRRPGFRWSHVGLMVFVAAQGALDRICPLTTWEFELRQRAGQEGREGTFVGRLARDLLFVDVPQETLNRIYVAFAALVLASLVLVRPRRRSPEPSASQGGGESGETRGESGSGGEPGA